MSKTRMVNAEDLEFLAEGRYNLAFADIECTTIYKIQKDKDYKMDDPERSVRLWNLINFDYDGPKAELVTIVAKDDDLILGIIKDGVVIGEEVILEKGESITCWSCPYVKGVRPNDNETSDTLIDVYNRFGRIITDAMSHNLIKTPTGKIVCIDVGMALDQEIKKEKVIKLADDSKEDQEEQNGLKRSYSDISTDAWNTHKAGYTDYFLENSYQQPISVQTIKALLYIRQYRPDISNVDFLKKKDTRILLAAAYTGWNVVKAQKYLKNLREVRGKSLLFSSHLAEKGKSVPSLEEIAMEIPTCGGMRKTMRV